MLRARLTLIPFGYTPHDSQAEYLFGNSHGNHNCMIVENDLGIYEGTQEASGEPNEKLP